MTDLKNAFEREDQIQNIPILMAIIQRKVREFSLAEFSLNDKAVESKYQYLSVVAPDDRDSEGAALGAYCCSIFKVPKFLRSASDEAKIEKIAEININPSHIWMQYSFDCNGYEEDGDLTINVKPNEVDDFIRQFTARVMPLIADPEDRFLVGLAQHRAEIHLIHGK